MLPPDRAAWGRLGPLLISRRTQISARYANRRTFAEETGMNWRTIHDIELAKRTTFRPETMRAFETAYQLVSGSLDRTLAGGDLEPAPAARTQAAPGRTPDEKNDEDEALRSIAADSRLSPELRRAFIALAHAMRDANGEERKRALDRLLRTRQPVLRPGLPVPHDRQVPAGAL